MVKYLSLNLHSTIFILKLEKLPALNVNFKFTFYYIYIKTKRICRKNRSKTIYILLYLY